MKNKIKHNSGIFNIVLLFIICMLLIYGIVQIFSNIYVLKEKVRRLEEKVEILENESRELWLNIDGLSESYTLLYNEIHRGNN